MTRWSTKIEWMGWEGGMKEWKEEGRADRIYHRNSLCITINGYIAMESCQSVVKGEVVYDSFEDVVDTQ